MENELHMIYEVQKLDTKIIEKEKRMQAAPKIMEGLEREIAELRSKTVKEKEIIDELEKERRNKEKELDDNKERIKKLEAKLYEVKTNKEYQAMLKEIEVAKEQNDRTEEDILILMEKIEELKNDYESSRAYLQKREKEVESEKGRLKMDIESVDKTLKGLKEERDNLLKVVNADLKNIYQMLLEKRGGKAVVNLKDGVCLGCYMNIPPQLFIEATKNKQLIQCPSCRRIFYFIENETEH